MRKIIAGITILLALGFGLLIASSSASATWTNKIWICHATSSETHPYSKIRVDVHGLNGHGDHAGDIIPAPAGGCPGPTPTEEPSEDPTPPPTTPGDSETPTTPAATTPATTPPQETETPEPTPTTATPTKEPSQNPTSTPPTVSTSTPSSITTTSQSTTAPPLIVTDGDQDDYLAKTGDDVWMWVLLGASLIGSGVIIYLFSRGKAKHEPDPNLAEPTDEDFK